MLVHNPFPDLVALEKVRCHWGLRETMNSCKIQKFLSALIVIAILSACSVPAELAPSATTPIASDEMGDIIAKYRREIPRLMEQENIPGLAIAVVDDQGTLWAEGFGFTDTDRRTPITPDTIFGVQSTSKVFTAVGVMRAVQEGLLDLDAPITDYLTDFTVRSIFEEHPERQITLRHLLSHTAGFTHEAPVGNNWDVDATSFEAHISSISDTWLRFPVGTGYAYSNLGIDLAGYILQTVTGRPFADYQRDQLFQPLGMGNSSFDMAVIGANPNRAIGHVELSPVVPLAMPFIPSGGMYTSANDLSRFVQFQLNRGVVDGRSVLSPALLDEMLTVQFPVLGQREGYALGVARTGWYRGRNADLFNHGGGGFGFISDLWWLPELKLGIAVLTNSSDHELQGSLALQILDDLVHQPGAYNDRLMALPDKSPVTEGDGRWRPPATLAADIAAHALPPDPAGWQDYLGDYQPIQWKNIVDPLSPPSRVYEQDGALYFDGSAVEDAAELRLYETAPGLFFTETGQALDLRASPPMYGSVKLARLGAGPSPVAWGILVACGLVMLSILLAPLVRLIARKAWPQRAEVHSPAPRRALVIVAGGLAVVASLCGLASIGLLVVIPRLVYSSFLGWLTLPLGQKLLFHAPLGLALCAVALVALAIPAWQQGWWRRGQRWLFTALAVAALVETALLANWRMIGLGWNA
jgi:CubicO group peptidase (beta-lactamase class C family)